MLRLVLRGLEWELIAKELRIQTDSVLCLLSPPLQPPRSRPYLVLSLSPYPYRLSKSN